MGLNDIFQRWQVQASYSPIDHQNFMDVRKNGGFSRNPLTGKSPTSGYMVGIHSRYGGVAHSVPLPDFGPEHLLKHREAATEHFKDPNVYQGGWADHNHVHLDVSRNIQDRDEAIAEGRKHDQIAIWDVAHNSEVPTGGRGEAE